MQKTLPPQIPLLILLLAAAAAASADVATSAAAERPDLLTFGRGTVFVSQSGLASGSASGALLAVNGDPYRMSLAADRQARSRSTAR